MPTSAGPGSSVKVWRRSSVPLTESTCSPSHARKPPPQSVSQIIDPHCRPEPKRQTVRYGEGEVVAAELAGLMLDPVGGVTGGDVPTAEMSNLTEEDETFKVNIETYCPLTV